LTNQNRYYFNLVVDGLRLNKNSIKLGQEEYDIIPKANMAAARALEYAYVRLGKPQDPFTTSGTKLVDVMISIWEDMYPLDAKTWYETRKEYKNAELTISEQVHKRTGRSLASFPLPIYQMMKKVFKGFDPAEKKNCLKMVSKWPMFQMANKV
jgi:hypothetical protein